MESGWNVWVWLSGGGCGWNLLVWLVGVFLIITYISLLLLYLLFFAAASLYIIESTDSISRDERDAPLTYNYSMAVLILIPGPTYCGGVPCPLWWCTMPMWSVLCMQH